MLQLEYFTLFFSIKLIHLLQVVFVVFQMETPPCFFHYKTGKTPLKKKENNRGLMSLSSHQMFNGISITIRQSSHAAVVLTILIINASSNSLCLYYMSCWGAWLFCCSCWMWTSLSWDALQCQLYSKPGYQWQQGGPPLGEVAMAPVRQVCHLQEIGGLLGWKIDEKNIEEAAGLKSPVCSVFDGEIQESKQTHKKQQ